MKNTFKKSDNHSENYLATIIKIDNLSKHPKADRLQIFNYIGRGIITGMDTKVGDVVIYFPVESALNSEYLKENNLFREAELNKDIDAKPGFFEQKGRVRAQKLQGIASEGFIMPLSSLEFKTGIINDKDIDSLIGTDFDTVDDLIICEKYYAKEVKQAGLPGSKKEKTNKLKDLLIDGQFKFHVETSHVDKHLHEFEPEGHIIGTYKEHGSSGIISNVLIKRNLSLIEKVAKFFGASIIENEYGFIYSSGKPKARLPKNIVGKYVNPNKDFYKSDIWSRLFNDKKHVLTKGMTIYGELVGYTEDGAFIQGGYDYGCKQGEYKFSVYRINITNVDGQTIEFSWDQIKEFCELKGLNTVQELFNCKAKDLFPEIIQDDSWRDNFLKKLKEVYLEGNCHMCVNKTPAEGIVLRKNGNISDFKVFKLKSKRFIEHETKQLDKGEIDMESAESIGD